MTLAATIDLLEGDMAGERRHETRAAIDQPSTLRDDRGVPRDVTVEDLSQTGFRYQSVERLAVGSLVRLGLSGAGAVTARIVWQDGDDHGCAFIEALTAAQVNAAFTAQQVVRVPNESDAGRDAATTGKWPRAVRMAIFIGGGAGAWMAAVALVKALG
jgi:hypothetical protein